MTQLQKTKLLIAASVLVGAVGLGVLYGQTHPLDPCAFTHTGHPDLSRYPEAWWCAIKPDYHK